MRYIQHPSNNVVFGAPKDWDQKELPCGALPITQTDDGCKVSFWQPSTEELKAITDGKPIMLYVYSAGHPVVALGVEGV